MKTQNFDEFARESHATWGRIPIAGSFEITWRCNLRCLHCYMCDYRPAQRELSTDEIRRILDEMAAAGCLRLLVTGGEPLLRPDFETIWLHTRSLGIAPTLFTNATLVTEERAAFLHEHPPVFCETTLYGASPATYGTVTGHPEAFETTLAGLERLARALPYVGAKSMLLRENLAERHAMAALCSRIGVAFNYDTDVFPRLDRDREPMRHALEPEEGVREVLGSAVHRNNWREMDAEAGPAEAPLRPPKRANKLVVCRAGEWTFHIGPYGDLCLCMMLREPFVSLQTASFAEAWETVVPRWLEIEKTQPSPCAECPDLRYCVPCAGRNYLETGDPEIPAPIQCRRAGAVARALRFVRMPKGRRKNRTA